MRELIAFCMYSSAAFLLLAVLINLANKPPKE